MSGKPAMNTDQWRAFNEPLIGREGEHLHTWALEPFSYALSFNR